METKYANAKRLLNEEILKSNRIVKDTSYVETIVGSLPYIGAILNSYRQVIFSNNGLLNEIGLEVEDTILGARPGEILKCRNANKEIGGCGTSENCSVCGAVNTILKCQETNEASVGECNIRSETNGESTSYEFKVGVSPIHINNEQYLIFSLIDISSERRRKVLEKIFFHDIINKASNMKSILDLCSMIEDESKLKEMSQLLQNVSDELLDEILAQRQISSAESDELVVNIEPANSLNIVDGIAKQIQHHNVALGKEINVDENAENVLFKTDTVLLKRVLLNMLKNALEASIKGDTVSIGCYKQNGNVQFRVHNPTFMPRDIQLQIFNRSFSTKGNNRGLGTYSIKLLGEKYLQGKVSFSSTEKGGTTFFIELPIQ